MKTNKMQSVKKILFSVLSKNKLLSAAILIVVLGAVVTALLPPLALEVIVNNLTKQTAVPFYLVLLYFTLTALSGLFDSAKESLLTLFGQKITRGLREALCAKLSRMPADAFTRQEPGATVSRFVGDVDTVEALFTSGVISMFADACKIISIFSVLFIKNRGLTLLLLLLSPLLFGFTRVVQKRMLKAQLANRVALGKVNNHVPETIRCIRMIHTLHKESYMRKKYDRDIQESYAAVEKTNFYDAVYSPVILILNALIIAIVMLLSASGNPSLQAFFGMSVGTAVAVVSYIGKVFSPIESIGMEIQTIQSALAGVQRINEFLKTPERRLPEVSEEEKIKEPAFADSPCIELKNVDFSYEETTPVLKNVSFTVNTGEQVTLAGRTGAGKSTIFKLLSGLYFPQKGAVSIYGKEAFLIPDSQKRSLFGYVEQNFCLVPGTIEEQITLFDTAISREMVEDAAKIVGLHDTILSFSAGYDTLCSPTLFSQGQWQLLSIARAICANPKILLLDEITANLDSDTEQTVLSALRNASKNRTVLSISHRLYEQNGGRLIEIR